MKKTRVLFFISFFANILNASLTFGQGSPIRQNILTRGLVEYERTDHLYAIAKNKLGEDAVSKIRYESYKRMFPQFQKSSSLLTFDLTSSSFTSQALRVNNDPLFDRTSIFSSIEPIKLDLINDESKIRWKITDEFREIAGFLCRRANGVFLDSIYVVAFYTDQIPVSSGPSEFRGLPGMILGAALPHLHISWFALKVIEKE